MSSIRSTLLNELEWRPIGPFRGGRVVAVAGDPVHDQVFYFGSTGGGVWKTEDGGEYWRNVSDGYFQRASVGALAVAPSDPNVIYAGLGESTIRGNVSHGDGVYRSTDAGKTWKHLGLAETRNIAKVRVHPHNPDLVYVAALGHAHGPNPERGVYRTTDGGATWELVLFKCERAGAIDLSLDPNNPRILFAAFWEARRAPYDIISGGPDSGIFRSTDGGDSWVEITRNKGLPQGVIGKVGVAVSPARSDRVWAIIEAEDGAVFRSDDGGDTWQRLSEDARLRRRSWYYHHIIADTKDPDTLYVLNDEFWKSIDGGKTFFEKPTPHGDNHELWIDPVNPDRLIEGNDGGACVSFNGGDSWSTIYNQMTAEFYHVTTDNQFPYRVYGAQQDNTTITTVSRSNYPAISNSETFDVGGGECGYIAVRPDDSNIVYAGYYGGLLTRYDRRTNQARVISVWPEVALGFGAADIRYRFQWTFPIVISPHDPDRLFVGGNHLFTSSNEGQSWEMISPDLTRAEPETLRSPGRPITKDGTGAETYATIFAFAESPVTAGVFWAGSDDGLVHVSRDGGNTWDNVTPPDLPGDRLSAALISIIEASPHDEATAYVAATRYKSDDFTPYLFRTSDFGKTWTRITAGIEANHFTRVIREDPVRRGLLYAGTEVGMYLSFDDGESWRRMGGNLPVVPIHDFVIKDGDLIVGTHGRSFWILDDLTPIRQAADIASEPDVHLFRVRDTHRVRLSRGFGSHRGPGKNFYRVGTGVAAYERMRDANGDERDMVLDAGKNLAPGVAISYYLKSDTDEQIRLTVLDDDGNVLRTFLSEDDYQKRPPPLPAETREPGIPKRPGVNRFIWDMRLAGASDLPGDEALAFMGGCLNGPMVAPGAYRVKLQVGDQEFTEQFQILPDPRVEAHQEDLEEQLALTLQVRDKLSETHEAVKTIRHVRTQLDAWIDRLKNQDNAGEIIAACEQLKVRMSNIGRELTTAEADHEKEILAFPKKTLLNAKLGTLLGWIGEADARPTDQQYEVFADLANRVDDQVSQLDSFLEADVRALNELLVTRGVEPVMLQ